MLEFIKKHKKGILGTIAFHGVLLILILSFGFSTPLPLPKEKGIMINFGNMPDASGSTELQKSQKETKVQKQQKQTQPQQSKAKAKEAEDIITQDHEEAPSVKDKQETQKKEQKQPEPTEEPTEQKEQKEQKEQAEPEREVNKNALYPGKSDEESGESEGETEGQGNQGRESGTPYSDNHANADSKGMGSMNYSLSGRNPESLPKPEYNYQVEGKVVVEITVDKYGNVTKAVAGVKGSTTLNENLLRAAKKAALNAKFDRDPSAPAYQKGTITYYFRLQ
jgi:TonB family protein